MTGYPGGVREEDAVHTAVRLGGFAALLGVLFAAAWGAGTLAGPLPGSSAPAAPMAGMDMAAMAPAPATIAHSTAEGLSSTEGGFTLVGTGAAFVANRPAPLRLTVTGPDGRPVTAFDTRPDGSELRVLAVRRDGTGLQIAYPTMAPDGTWTTPLTLPTAGAWRVTADFTPLGAAPSVLGTDVFVPGDFAPQTVPPTRAAEVDGYQVRLDGELRPGTESAIFATVSRDGKPVTDLEPDRGTFATAVALRAGDLAYTPVTALTRASPADRSGPGIALSAAVPTAGTYRIVLQFRHAGQVHTVDFAVPTAGLATPATPTGGDR